MTNRLLNLHRTGFLLAGVIGLALISMALVTVPTVSAQDGDPTDPESGITPGDQTPAAPPAADEAPAPPAEGEPPAADAPTPDGWTAPPAAPVETAPATPPQGQPIIPPQPESTPNVASGSREQNCSDRQDDDNDGMVDCADADCYGQTVCEAGDSNENNNERCSDWVDNDGDGHVDCDDDDCSGPGITVCNGSATQSSGASADPSAVPSDLPPLEGDMTVEDLIGTGGDIDGERNNVICGDGIDNDGDGAIDCADFGCRFDPNVTVCRGTPGIRFSVVAGIGFTAGTEFTPLETDVEGWSPEVDFTRLQLRVFGPMPLIQDSFFLLSMRAERTPRVTFAMFQFPLSSEGHFININSGGGGLSAALIRSGAKQLLLNQPFFVYSAFEQGNGAAVEVGGPLALEGLLQFRAFAAGGSGEFNGNVGGRFFRGDDTNFTWNVGAQLIANLAGRYNRFDTPFLYTPVPLTVAAVVGAKYDQRANERYPAVNAQFIVRWNRLVVLAEAYGKYELDFEAFQMSYLVQAGALIVPKMLMLAVDFGQFFAQDFANAAGAAEAGVTRPIDEWQLRAALHWYFWKNVGVASLLYTEHHFEENPNRPQDAIIERSFQVNAQIRW